MNQITLIGHLGADARVSQTHGGNPVVNLRVATTESWKDKGGTKHEHTEWWNVTMFGPGAAAVAPYMVSGGHVYLQGSGKLREYTNRDGVVCKQFEVHAETWKLLGSKQGAKATDRPTTSADAPTVFDAAADDIAF